MGLHASAAELCALLDWSSLLMASSRSSCSPYRIYVATLSAKVILTCSCVLLSDRNLDDVICM